MHTVGKVANVTPVCHQSVSGSLQGGSREEGWGGVIKNGSQTGSLTKRRPALLMRSVRSCAFHKVLGRTHVTQAAKKWHIVPG